MSMALIVFGELFYFVWKVKSYRRCIFTAL